MEEHKYNIPIDLIKQKYFVENKSQEAIANELNISQWVISQRMRTNNIPRKSKTRNLTHQKYVLDHNALDKLNEKSSWILGWLISDGFVNRGKYVFGIKVAEKDKDIVEKLKNFFCYNGPIYKIISSHNKSDKKFRQVELLLTSKRLVSRLGNFGIKPNKSLTVKFPNLISRSRDENIIRSFIKGVFEGDGSILLENKSSLLFQIVGTKELLTKIQSYLIKYVGVSKTRLTQNVKNRNHFALRYRGRYQAMKIFDWIYKNTDFYLDRKYNRYLNIKKHLCSV